MKKSNCLKWVAGGLVIAVALVGYCGKAEAQPWPHPHPHPHPHHHHHHHPGFRPLIPPVVARYVPAYPIVVRPTTRVVYSVLASNPAPTLVRAVVVNPASTGATLSFTIDGERYELAPGTRQEMQLAGVRTIEFDRGGAFGQASYSLLPGIYLFKATTNGWDLQRQVPAVSPAVSSVTISP